MTCKLHLPFGGPESLPCATCELVGLLGVHATELQKMVERLDGLFSVNWLESYNHRTAKVELLVRIPRKGKLVRR